MSPPAAFLLSVGSSPYAVRRVCRSVRRAPYQRTAPFDVDLPAASDPIGLEDREPLERGEDDLDRTAGQIGAGGDPLVVRPQVADGADGGLVVEDVDEIA